MQYARSSSTFMPSTPADPLFCSTCLHARLRFPLSSILSSVIGAVFVLLMQIYPVAVSLIPHQIRRVCSLSKYSSSSGLLLLGQASVVPGALCPSYRAFLSRFQAGSPYFRTAIVQPFPYTLRVLRLLLTSCDSLLLASRPHKISLGKNVIFLSIYPPSLHSLIRLATGLHDSRHTHPQRLPEKVPVRRTGDLLAPSFSLPLTRHTLGFANPCHQRPDSGLSPYR